MTEACCLEACEKSWPVQFLIHGAFGSLCSSPKGTGSGGPLWGGLGRSVLRPLGYLKTHRTASGDTSSVIKMSILSILMGRKHSFFPRFLFLFFTWLCHQDDFSKEQNFLVSAFILLNRMARNVWHYSCFWCKMSWVFQGFCLFVVAQWPSVSFFFFPLGLVIFCHQKLLKRNQVCS